MDYALGAAYIVAPEAESEIGKFLIERSRTIRAGENKNLDGHGLTFLIVRN